MSEKRFFQLSFLLPIVLPLLTVFFTNTTALGSLGGILIFSLILGGLPYLLFITGLFFWSRNESAKDIQRITFAAPLLFIPVFLLSVLFFVPIQLITTGKIDVNAGIVFACCVFIIILGYMYVLVVNGVYFLFKALKH